MSFESNFLSLVETLYEDVTILLATEYEANRQSYDLAEMTVDKPLIYLITDIPKDKEVQENFNILSTMRFRYRVLAKANRSDTTAEQESEIIEDLELIADTIYLAMLRGTQFRLKGGELGNYRLTKIWKTHNSILSGVEVSAVLKENQSRPCKPVVEEGD